MTFIFKTMATGDRTVTEMFSGDLNGATNGTKGNMCYTAFAVLFNCTRLSESVKDVQPPENSISDEAFYYVASLRRLLTECSYQDQSGAIFTLPNVGELKKLAHHFVAQIAHHSGGQLPEPLKDLDAAIDAITLADKEPIDKKTPKESTSTHYSIARDAFNALSKQLELYLSPHIEYRIRVGLKGFCEAGDVKTRQQHLARIRNFIFKVAGWTDKFVNLELKAKSVSKSFFPPSGSSKSVSCKVIPVQSNRSAMEDAMEMFCKIVDMLSVHGHSPYPSVNLTIPKQLVGIGPKDTKAESDKYTQPTEQGLIQDTTAHACPQFFAVVQEGQTMHRALTTRYGERKLDEDSEVRVVLPDCSIALEGAGLQHFEEGVYLVKLKELGMQMDRHPGLFVVHLLNLADTSIPGSYHLPAEFVSDSHDRPASHLKAVVSYNHNHYQVVYRSSEGTLKVFDALAGKEVNFNPSSHAHCQLLYGSANQYVVYEQASPSEDNSTWEQALTAARATMTAPVVPVAFPTVSSTGTDWSSKAEALAKSVETIGSQHMRLQKLQQQLLGLEPAMTDDQIGNEDVEGVLLFLEGKFDEGKSLRIDNLVSTFCGDYKGPKDFPKRGRVSSFIGNLTKTKSTEAKQQEQRLKLLQVLKMMIARQTYWLRCMTFFQKVLQDSGFTSGQWGSVSGLFVSPFVDYLNTGQVVGVNQTDFFTVLTQLANGDQSVVTNITMASPELAFELCELCRDYYRTPGLILPGARYKAPNNYEIGRLSKLTPYIHHLKAELSKHTDELMALMAETNVDAGVAFNEEDMRSFRMTMMRVMHDKLSIKDALQSQVFSCSGSLRQRNLVMAIAFLRNLEHGY